MTLAGEGRSARKGFVILAATMLAPVMMLGGCGSASEKSDDTPAVPPGAASVTVDGKTLSSQQGKCDGLPPFVKLYAGAKIEGCFSGDGGDPKHMSGTVVYTAPDKAATIKDWYKSIAKSEGMASNIDVDTPNPTFSARDGTKKSFMMMSEAAGDGTKITLNWGMDR